MTITLSMVNTWLSLFSPYFRKCENDVLGYPIWSNLSEILLPKSRYLRGCKIDFLTAEEESQCVAEEESGETEETECTAEAFIKEEGYEEEIHTFKAWKEVRRMYSESISVGCVR